MKYFIITIDTECDNPWAYKLGNKITTTNAQFIPRFQELCNKYKFKPVYLTSYEMLNDPFFVEFAQSELLKQNCEIGIHFHAWNTPPNYELTNSYPNNGLPYLIEYPQDVMQKKFDCVYNLLTDKFKTEIVSHRSGRWAMDQRYFDLLIDYGIKIDCSVTPNVSWKTCKGFTRGSVGTNYKKHPESAYTVHHSDGAGEHQLLEVPVTIRKLKKYLYNDDAINLKKHLQGFKSRIFGKTVWLRPTVNNLHDMMFLTDFIRKSQSDYLMFMLHSCELMPGGSLNFVDDSSIEKLYLDLEILFKEISKFFTGITLKDFYAARVKNV